MPKAINESLESVAATTQGIDPLRRVVRVGRCTQGGEGSTDFVRLEPAWMLGGHLRLHCAGALFVFVK